MIPPAIEREHVLVAAAKIDRDRVPPMRESRTYKMVHNGQRYPPKYIVSIAGELATHSELPPQHFNAAEAVHFLRRLGFTIEVFAPPTSAPQSLRHPSGTERKGTTPPAKVRPAGHTGERCRLCKQAIYALLTAAYGTVEPQKSFGLTANGGEFVDTPLGSAVAAIRMTLAQHRGFRDFIRGEFLTGCDWFVPDPGFIVEFDESQHFTRPRALSLQQYPSALGLGFDRERWIKLCLDLDRHDDDPPDRDEQRAWYDALRDFLPALMGFHPTVRLYAGDSPWCSVDPGSETDVHRFRELIQSSGRPLEISSGEVRTGANLARIVLVGPWLGEPDAATRLLQQVAREWPTSHRVQFLLTPGAFVTFKAPASLLSAENNLNPGGEVLNRLFQHSQQIARGVVRGQLRDELARCARYLTLGIDSRKTRISQTHNRITEPHAETVVVMDLESGDTFATGKSYPTSAQEATLIRNPDPENHFPELGGRQVMVLGCHDLTLFNPRARRNAKGWRKRVIDAFTQLAREHSPSIVLHHPHTTIKRSTWQHAWHNLRRELPTVRSFAGAGRYSADDVGWAKRSSIEEVLCATATSDCVDILVRPGMHHPN